MPESKDRPILEATLESSEVVIDMLMRGDVLADVPVIGTAIKMCRAADSIREKAFAAKLVRFVSALGDVSEKRRQKIKIKLSASPEEARKIGEMLFLILERITDLSKPFLLAQLFLGYIDGVITSAELRRMSQAVDASFSDDLKLFLEAESLPAKSEEAWMQFLVPAGLTQVVGGSTFGDVGGIYYKVSALGDKLRSVYCHVKNARGYSAWE
jgi:hypothetical protein